MLSLDLLGLKFRKADCATELLLAGTSSRSCSVVCCVWHNFELVGAEGLKLQLKRESGSC